MLEIKNNGRVSPSIIQIVQKSKIFLVIDSSSLLYSNAYTLTVARYFVGSVCFQNIFSKSMD